MEKIKQIFKTLLLITALLAFSSCDKDDDFGEQHDEQSQYAHVPGLFIISEGNYSFGNGSLAFYDPLKRKVDNEIFYAANNRPLGDVPFQAEIFGDQMWITVNNSGKVEVMNLESMKSVATWDNLGSPRHLNKINEDLVFVSDLESADMKILNPDNDNQHHTMDAGKSTEAMLYDGHYLFACNWSNFYVSKPNNTITVINTAAKKVVTTIEVAKEPNSMVADKNGYIWVLSSGGYDNSEYPALSVIDPVQLIVSREIRFDSKNASPNNLCISPNGDSLYFINRDIYAISITDTALPSQEFIRTGNRAVTSLAVDPQNGDVYFGNAVDYQQKGWVLRYNPYSKTMTDSFRVGIIPGAMRFYKP
ncbi:MAG: SMP-30/gluconolactonase/LRE family protein [Bacteroidales bacterium]